MKMNSPAFFTAIRLKIILLLVILSASFRPLNDKGDEITGRWINEDKSIKIEIYKNNDRYYGNLVWSPDLKIQKYMGAVVLSNFIYNPVTNNYSGTFIARNGKNKDARITLTNYLLFSITINSSGKTAQWTRTSE